MRLEYLEHKKCALACFFSHAFALNIELTDAQKTIAVIGENGEKMLTVGGV